MCEKSASNLWWLRANVPGVGRGEVEEGLKRRRGTHGTFQSPQRAAPLTRIALQNGPGPFGVLALTRTLNFLSETVQRRLNVNTHEEHN